jgi:starch phosphorylase
MTSDKTNMGSSKPTSLQASAQEIARYQCGPLGVGNADSYDCHVVFDHAVSLEEANHRERFEGVAKALRDLLTQRWLLTEET